MCVHHPTPARYPARVADLHPLLIALLVFAGVFGLLLLSNVLLWLAAVFFPRLEKHIRRNEPPVGSSTGVSAAAADHPSPPEDDPVGRDATTLTPLRPAGKIELAGQRRDAESVAGYLEKHTPVTITARRGDTLLVKPREA